ncbi:hypothetical protein CLOP_g11515 [Closterium sp. NIES-67]|nr:hypothetical protein CLOP_g11515 [Closterium sp. NIES-67]
MSGPEPNGLVLRPNEPLGAQQAAMIFVRRPVPGRVKTRLAAAVGPEAACDFYRACCEHVVSAIARCPDLQASTHIFIFFSEPSDESEIKRWMHGLLPSPNSLRFVSQVAGDVGARMQAAFQHVLALGYHRVVVVGTDIPDVSGATVAAALSALRQHGVVFGLALDGGYYLLGLTAVRPCLFNAIDWSTERVLQQSLAALRASGVADVAPLDSLPHLRDIDTVRDLAAWLADKLAARDNEGAVSAVGAGATLSDCRRLGHEGDEVLRAGNAGVRSTDIPGCAAVAKAGEEVRVVQEAQGLTSQVARILSQTSVPY